MATCSSLTIIMTSNKLRFRHLNALGMVGDNSFACLLELPWIFPGAQSEINGVPCGIRRGLIGMHLKCWHNQMICGTLSIAGGGVSPVWWFRHRCWYCTVLMTTCGATGGGGAVGLAVFCFQWLSCWICFSWMCILYQDAIKHLFILSYLTYLILSRAKTTHILFHTAYR